MANIFRQAAEILRAKDAGAELTDEDQKVLGAAMILLNNRACGFLQDLTVIECFDEMTRWIEDGEKG